MVETPSSTGPRWGAVLSQTDPWWTAPGNGNGTDSVSQRAAAEQPGMSRVARSSVATPHRGISAKCIWSHSDDGSKDAK